ARCIERCTAGSGRGPLEKDLHQQTPRQWPTGTLQHTASGLGGGLVVVDVVGVGTDLARIEVTDDGADTIPRPRSSDGLDSGGRGLRLVEQISTTWGLRRLGRSRHLTVWAEFTTATNSAHLCEVTSNVLMREIGA
ncbi:hypothetical protein ACFOY2_42175, partial [Nonomuraea purpurea]